MGGGRRERVRLIRFRFGGRVEMVGTTHTTRTLNHYLHRCQHWYHRHNHCRAAAATTTAAFHKSFCRPPPQLHLPFERLRFIGGVNGALHVGHVAPHDSGKRLVRVRHRLLPRRELRARVGNHNARARQHALFR